MSDTATPATYQAYQPSIQPTWLQGPFGSSWGATLGSVKDILVTKTQNAIKCSIIATPTQVPFGSIDSLAFNGADRGIDRGQNETDAAYATRVLGAWNSWPFGGTPQGILKALYDGGYPNVTIVQQLGQQYTITVDAFGNVTLVLGSNQWRWIFDSGSPAIPLSQANVNAWTPNTNVLPGAVVVPSPANGYWYESANPAAMGTATGLIQPAWPTGIGQFVCDNGLIWQCKGRDFWSRFGVLFTQPFPTSWGGTPPADGSAEVLKIKKIISKFKAAHSTCVVLAALTGDGVAGWTWDYRPTGATWNSQGRSTWDSQTIATYWTPPTG